MNNVTFIGTKTCTSCRLDLPVADFNLRDAETGKRQSWCRICRATHPSIATQMPRDYVWWLPCSLCGETFKRIGNQGRRNGNVYCGSRCSRRGTGLRKKYGLEPRDFRAMWQRQAGICAMPGCLALLNVFGAAGCHVDHDHETGVVRGILCHSCNVGLGWYERLRAAGADFYLQPKEAGQ